MDALTLDKDTIERPVINSWRAAPSAAQTRYAASLCRSELSYAERVRTIESFGMLDASEMSALIARLEQVREARYRRLRRLRRGDYRRGR